VVVKVEVRGGGEGVGVPKKLDICIPHSFQVFDWFLWR